MAEPLKWDKVIETDGYKNLSGAQKEDARRQYFRDVVAPQVPVGQRTAAWSQFDTATGSKEVISADSPEAAQMTHIEPNNPLYDYGIDYKTGVPRGVFRAGFSRMDTDEERTKYLDGVVGQGNWGTDSRGRYTLEPEGLAALGITSEKTRVIDEVGPTWYDVSDAAGFAPSFVASVGAGMATSGYGALPGAVMVAGAAMVAKGIDEIVEYAQGHNLQSAGEVTKDVATEGAFAGVGEGIFRPLGAAGAKVLGPHTRRPGPYKPDLEVGPSGEILNRPLTMPQPRGPRQTTVDPERARLATNLQRLGGTPSIQQAAGPVANISGRIQGMIHTVLGDPLDAINRKAIFAGRREVLEEVGPRVSGAGAGRGTINVVREQLSNARAAVDTAVKNVARTSRQQVAGIRGLITSGGEGIDKAIRSAKESFSSGMAATYTAIDDMIGNQAVVPSKPLKDLADELSSAFPTTSNGGKAYSESGLEKLINDAVGMPDAITFKQAQNIRQVLRDASYNPELLGNVTKYRLGQFREAIDKALDSAGDFVMTRQSTILDEAGNPYLLTIQISDETAVAARNALENADAAYREGISRFDDTVIQRLGMKSGQEGSIDPQQAAAAIWRIKDPDRVANIRGVVSPRVWGNVLDDHLGQIIHNATDQATGNVNALQIIRYIDGNKPVFNAMYGSEANSVYKLFKDLTATNTKVNLAGLRGNSSIVRAAQASLKATRDLDALLSKGLIKQIDGGKLMDDQIVSYIFRPGAGASPSRIREVRNHLGADSPQWGRIQSRAMQDLLGNMVDSVSDPVKPVISGIALRRAMESYGETNMKTMFGKETFEALETFSRTVHLATTKKQSGGIVAANIALHPVRNLGRLAMMSVMSKWMTGGGLKYYTEGLEAKTLRASSAFISRSMIELNMLAEDHMESTSMIRMGLQLPAQ